MTCNIKTRSIHLLFLIFACGMAVVSCRKDELEMVEKTPCEPLLHVQWGGFWVMPTQEQIQELTSNCSCTWTRRNGVDGDLFTGPNGCTVFLPESDFWRKGRDKGGIDVFNGGTDELPCAGYYWSSTLNPSNSNSFSSYLLTSYGKAYWDHYNFRSTGLTVRPVVSETNSIYVPVSSLYGMKVADNAAETSTLPPGIYIVNGKKMVVK